MAVMIFCARSGKELIRSKACSRDTIARFGRGAVLSFSVFVILRPQKLTLDRASSPEILCARARGCSVSSSRVP